MERRLSSFGAHVAHQGKIRLLRGLRRALPFVEHSEARMVLLGAILAISPPASWKQTSGGEALAICGLQPEPRPGRQPRAGRTAQPNGELREPEVGCGSDASFP